MSERKCKNCRFWEIGDYPEPPHLIDSLRINGGLCKRYPRTQGKLDIDWCGEWQALAESIDAKQSMIVKHMASKGYSVENLAKVFGITVEEIQRFLDWESK